jgi:hypothetical protein
MQLIESAAASLPLLSALPLAVRVDLPLSYREAFARLEQGVEEQRNEKWRCAEFWVSSPFTGPAPSGMTCTIA